MAYCKHFIKQSGELMPNSDVQEDNEQGSTVPLLEPTEESNPNVTEQPDNVRERQLETTSNSPVHATVSEMDQGLPIPREIPSSSTEGTSSINENTSLHSITQCYYQVSPHLSEQRDDGSQ